ncbi:Protein CBG05882 [Caenorhabditis briggsae]|uniref:Protein CBG05882 n=1 Tax=Caenorhabditis briggsae TaxID=6238 RepID=A8X1F3_CAEBR|nr:Protein CBG05882 [Caenorhabditis briggsae]CAP26463.1 Protein CBG05882 [Caenorhabditis briggsae]
MGFSLNFCLFSLGYFKLYFLDHILMCCARFCKIFREDSNSMNRQKYDDFEDFKFGENSAGLTPEAGALLHGYGIVAQLSLNAVQKLLSEQKSTQKISGEQLFGISDAPFAVKLRCNYPDFPPFLGSQIDMDSIPLMDASFPTHLFLEFFQLDDQLFDEPEYRSEFGNSRLLKNYATEEAKKKKFVQVSSAKKSFKLIRFELNALKELRLGTFIIADGSSQGYFARRKRHIAKSKAHDAGEEEEES